MVPTCFLQEEDGGLIDFLIRTANNKFGKLDLYEDSGKEALVGVVKLYQHMRGI